MRGREKGEEESEEEDEDEGEEEDEEEGDNDDEEHPRAGGRSQKRARCQRRD